ncbi:MAG: hypothetical protein AB7V56_13770 [Candidatus Nitrosocosmicus sp.]
MDKEKNEPYEYSGKDFICPSCGICYAVLFLVSGIRDKNRPKRKDKREINDTYILTDLVDK